MFDLEAFREQSLPTEAQMISQWEGNLTSPLVSVICTAYNQESYIEDALKGFLMQKTDFPFEIIIHDDASTDKTADIINDYTKKYPLIIKPILQKDNQYSINGHLPLLNTIAVASGQYLALCEGDDFWINKNKLQIQVEELKKNENVNIVITSALSLLSDGSPSDFCDLGNRTKIISFENCVLGPDKDFYPTASFLVRAELLNDLPEWFYNEAPVGDYYIQLFGSYPNGCIYLPIQTVIYRLNALGSLSSVMDNIKLIDLREGSYRCGKRLLKMYGSNKLFRDAIKQKQIEYLFNLCIVAFRMNEIRSSVKYICKSFLLNPFFTSKYFSNKVIRKIKTTFL